MWISFFPSKGGGLSTKAFCWDRFWKCDQQKVLQHKASSYPSFSCSFGSQLAACHVMPNLSWWVIWSYTIHIDQARQLLKQAMWANYEQKKFYSTGTNDDLLSGLRYDLYCAKRHVLQEVHEICIWNVMYIHMYHL